MPSRFMRNVFISAIALTSLGTLAYATFADETRSSILFSCVVPRKGSARCGDPDQNVRVGPEKRLIVDWTTSTATDPKTCITFTVFHAVSDKQLASQILCGVPKAILLWPNPDKKSVDVYVTVGSNANVPFQISGFYHVNSP